MTMLGDEGPSPSKQEKLRAQGLVPSSRCAISCLTLAAVLLFVPQFRAWWSDFLESWQGVVRRPPANAAALAMQLCDAARQVAGLVFTPLLCVMVCALVFGLCQTKFLFKTDLLSFRLERLSPLRGAGAAAALRRLAGALLLWAASLALAYAALRGGLPMLSAVFKLRPQETALWPYLFYRRAAAPVLLALGLAAGVGWLAARLAFRLRHAMTREELEKENRERE